MILVEVGETLQIRVAINVTQPLVRALLVRTLAGDELVVSFTYERLQNLCYFCGRLSHIYALCALRSKEGFQDPGEAPAYDAWLRGPPRSWVVCKLWRTTDLPLVQRNSPSYIARPGGIWQIHDSP
ncbi:UNVERIFIED_CONTAM: hypothetical protein Sangu_1709700 [Sesamum angustifolium]|uniref:Zinc knuckle CX2CX4HX4C domain-containing protein n=1 Tax=Sesamum angustifolium TaxID=2727405 RepID=A0AAW2MK57_9LAMI